MAWISVHQHVKGRKLRDFAKDMKVRRAEALGLLVSLWIWGIDNADSDGNMGEVDARDIAEACMYEGRKSADLFDALIRHRWIDCEDGEYIIHDWDEWQAAWFKSLERREQSKRIMRKRRANERAADSEQNNDNNPLTVSKQLANNLHNVSDSPSPSPSPKDNTNTISYEIVRDSFLSLCPSLPKIMSLSEKRKSAIRARAKDGATIETFEDVFKAVEASDFLTGRDGKWTGCGFDWILRPENWQKIREGNYAKDRGRVPDASRRRYIPGEDDIT